MTEALQPFAHTAFYDALIDANMQAPNYTGPLFDLSIYDIRLSADGGINNAAGNLNVPDNKIIIVINVGYGERKSYMDDDQYEDWMMSMRLSIYGNTGASIDDALQRIHFATQNRKAVFSSHNILDIGIDEHPRYRPFDVKIGMGVMDYTLKFRYAMYGTTGT